MNEPMLFIKLNQSTTKGVGETIIDAGALLALRAPSSTARRDNDKVRKLTSMMTTLLLFQYCRKSPVLQFAEKKVGKTFDALRILLSAWYNGVEVAGFSSLSLGLRDVAALAHIPPPLPQLLRHATKSGGCVEGRDKSRLLLGI